MQEHNYSCLFSSAIYFRKYKSHAKINRRENQIVYSNAFQVLSNATHQSTVNPVSTDIRYNDRMLSCK